MLDLLRDIHLKMSIYNYLNKKNNRNFGILLSVILFIFWIYTFKNELSHFKILIFLTISVLITIFSPNFFILFNFFWMGIGIILALVFSNVLLIIFYYLIFTPISLMNRMFKKNFFNLLFNNKNSYWVERKKGFKPMRYQY